MAQYVYKYVHPEKGCIYVGRTCNLTQRIRSHDSNSADNIDRSYEHMLRECDVYFIEVANKSEAIIVETYLIDKEKPILNKVLKDEKHTSSIEISLPQFTRYNDSNRRYVDDKDNWSARTQPTVRGDDDDYDASILRGYRSIRDTERTRVAHRMEYLDDILGYMFNVLSDRQLDIVLSIINVIFNRKKDFLSPLIIDMNDMYDMGKKRAFIDDLVACTHGYLMNYNGETCRLYRWLEDVRVSDICNRVYITIGDRIGLDLLLRCNAFNEPDRFIGMVNILAAMYHTSSEEVPNAKPAQPQVLL